MDIYTLPKKVFYFSKEELWTLFLISAFPIHVWTIILVLRDFSWVSERTDSWDAVGVGAYGLLIAFAESLLVFIIAILISALIRDPWKEGRKIVLLFTLVMVVSIWAMINQLYFLSGLSIPESVFRFLTRQAHPLRVIYILVLGVVAPTVLLPIYFVIKSDKFVNGLQGVIDRISLLMMFYLVLDVGGLIIVIIRNL